MLAALAVLCLQVQLGFAQSNEPQFYLARFDYFIAGTKCEDPANPVSKLFKTAKRDPVELEGLLNDFPNDECAEIVRSEIRLATKVVDYLQTKKFRAIMLLEKADDADQLLGKARAPKTTLFLLHCAVIFDVRAKELNFSCAIKPINGEYAGNKHWKHDIAPLEKTVDLFGEETSKQVTALCMEQMPAGQYGHH
jgi:hypothetical protein